MKKKYRLKRKVKITSVILVTLIFAVYLFAGGFNTLKSAYNSMINYLAAGDTPTIAKNIEDKHDGTYQLSLSVKGEAEKKVPKTNIIVIVDRSGSMDSQSGTGAYVPTTSTGNGLYGLVDGQYVPLERRGTSGNRTFWYNGVQYTGQRYQYDGTATRLQATQAAVNGLAGSLLGYNGKDGNPNDTVEMALVSFATNAQTNVANTTSASTFVSAVNNLDADGGTNWEAALQQANGINFGDDDPTYVIFFSDGSPTFHSTNGGYNNWNQTYRVYGSGQEQEPNMERSYTQAVDDATTLANKVGANNFYTIFAYGTRVGAGYMANLTTAAGAPAGNNYSASNTAELQDAFDEILENIEMAGIGEAVIDDGTTGEVKISSTDEHGLLRVDESSYKYTISFPINSDGKVQLNGKEATVSGNKITWGDGKELVGEVQGNNFIYTWTEENDLYDFVPEATNTNGKVEWDLSECGVLVNEATYTVYFDVYPSQETYDMIAKIKNGKTTDERKALYDALDENVKKYLASKE